MSSDLSLTSVISSEWIKFRSVRSTVLGVVTTFLLTVGIGALITAAIRANWNATDPLHRLAFDPVTASLGGTLFAQFAVGVIGALFITSEYSSGSIRSTLAAVPVRATVVLAKFVVLVSSILVVTELACFSTFLLGQRIFLGVVPTASLANSSVLRSVIFGGLYLTLLAVLGFGIGLILQQTAACISVFTSLLLVLPIVSFLLPQSWQNSYSKFEPSTLGQSMMTPTTPDNALTAGVALGLLAVYVIVVLIVGTTLLQRRDA